MVPGLLSRIVMIALCCAAASSLWAQPVITVSPTTGGGWNFSVDKNNVAGGPGGDVTGEYESPADTETLNISGCTGVADTWRIDIKKTDILWDGDLVISARVTNEGTGEGTFSAFESYRVVTDVLQPFLSGTGDRSGISIQLKINGISVSLIQAGRYNTNLVYSVTDTE